MVIEQPKKPEVVAPVKQSEPIVSKEIVTIYVIQLGASKTYIDPAFFKNKFKLADEVLVFKRDGWYKYATGQFKTAKEAQSKLDQLGLSGFVTAVDKSLLKKSSE